MTGVGGKPIRAKRGGITFGPCRSFAPPRLLWASHPSDCEAGLPAHAEAFTRSVDCRELYQRAGTAGREASHRSVIVCRCSARQPARTSATLPFSPGLVSGRTACPRQGSGRSPCKKKRKRPVEANCPSASTRVVQYATLPGRDGVGWPGGSVVEGSDTLRLRPAAVTDRTCRSLRPTTHRFACADVPRAAGRKLCIGI
jgi:hypothetical protein